MDDELYKKLSKLLDAGKDAAFVNALRSGEADGDVCRLRATLLGVPWGRGWTLLMQAVWHLSLPALTAIVDVTGGAVETTTADGRGVLDAIEEREREQGVELSHSFRGVLGPLLWELFWALLHDDRWASDRGMRLLQGLVSRLHSRGARLDEYLTQRSQHHAGAAGWTLAQQAVGSALRLKTTRALDLLVLAAPDAFRDAAALQEALRITVRDAGLCAEEPLLQDLRQRFARRGRSKSAQQLRERSASPQRTPAAVFPLIPGLKRWSLQGKTGAFETEVLSGKVKDGAGAVVGVLSVARVVGDQPFEILLRAYMSPEERSQAPLRDVLAATLHGARLSSDLRGVAVQVRSGEIVKELRAAGRDRPLFVLPSQLNACEYPSQNHVVEHVADYVHDNTGGPRGQLACHPAVAQALLDAAASDRSPNGFHGLRDVLPTLRQHGWDVKNGYLQFPNFGTRGGACTWIRC